MMNRQSNLGQPFHFGSPSARFDVTAKQLQPMNLPGENTGLKHSWTKSVSCENTAAKMNNEAGDCRRSFITSYKGMQNLNKFAEQENVGISAAATAGNSGLNLSTRAGGGAAGSGGWKGGKRPSNSFTSGVGSSAPEESDGNDSENTNFSSGAVLQQQQTMFNCAESPRSKASSSSFNECTVDNESFCGDGGNTGSPMQMDTTTSPPFNKTRRSSSTILNEALHSTTSSQQQQLKRTSSLLLGAKNPAMMRRNSNANAINFITIVGMLLGMVISKAFQYLYLYFCWFQNQVVQLRNAVLGPCTLWEFFNFEDNSRYGLRTKLMLLPIVISCSLLYAFLGIIIFAIRFLLTKAPNGLVSFIQRLNGP